MKSSYSPAPYCPDTSQRCSFPRCAYAAQGLAIATTEAQVGAIQSGAGGQFFIVTGTIDQPIASGKPVELRLAASGVQGAALLGIDLGAGWKFGDSFLALNGKPWTPILPTTPWFYFAGQPETGYLWPGSSTPIALAAGLNFAGNLKLAGYLLTATDLVPGLQLQPSYVLSGRIDPSANPVQTAAASDQPV